MFTYFIGSTNLFHIALLEYYIVPPGLVWVAPVGCQQVPGHRYHNAGYKEHYKPYKIQARPRDKRIYIYVICVYTRNLIIPWTSIQLLPYMYSRLGLAKESCSIPKPVVLLKTLPYLNYTVLVQARFLYAKLCVVQVCVKRLYFT